MDKRGTQVNGPKDKKGDNSAHPRDDIDILYVSRKEVGRVLVSFMDFIEEIIQGLEKNIKKREDNLQRPVTTMAT